MLVALSFADSTRLPSSVLLAADASWYSDFPHIRRMSLSGLTDTHRAYLLHHLRPLPCETNRAGEVRNGHLHHVRRLFTAWSSGTRTDALCRSTPLCPLPLSIPLRLYCSVPYGTG